MRTTSGCQPGLPLDSNAIEILMPQLVDDLPRRQAALGDACSTTNARPPVQSRDRSSGPASAERSRAVVETSADGLSIDGTIADDVDRHVDGAGDAGHFAGVSRLALSRRR